jgi:hypothetical protein
MKIESFDKGCEALQAQDYRAAVREFRKAMQSIDEQHELYNKVASYLGLAQVLTSDLNGLLICRDAASTESEDGDVFLNLACAEWHIENRERAVDAIMRGRRIDVRHAQLDRVSQLLDSRRRSIFPFLPRQHLLNRTMGRLMRRRAADELTVHALLYQHILTGP